MFNSGFAASWVQARVATAEPAPAGGETYARALIAQGDTAVPGQPGPAPPDPGRRASSCAASTHRTPALYDPRTPTAWARHIDVPVYLAGAFQDEQTGPQWPALVPALSADPHVWVTMVNGTHMDSLGPAVLSRWLEFLDIFVARQVPHISPPARRLSGSLYQLLADAPAEPLPPLRFTDAAERRRRHGRTSSRTPAGPGPLRQRRGQPGPGPSSRSGRPASPPGRRRRAVHHPLDLGAGGHDERRPRPRHRQSTVSFRPDPAARPATDLPATADVWAALPPYDWTPVTGSDGLGFVSPRRCTKDLVVVGPASLDLELRVDGPRHRPPGDRLRGHARRQGDVRAVGLPPGQRPGPRRRPPRPPPSRCPPTSARTARALPARPVHRGAGPDRPDRVRLPGRRPASGVTVTRPGGDTTGVGLRHLPTRGQGHRHGRPRGSRPSALVLSVVPGHPRAGRPAGLRRPARASPAAPTSRPATAAERRAARTGRRPRWYPAAGGQHAGGQVTATAHHRRGPAPLRGPDDLGRPHRPGLPRRRSGHRGRRARLALAHLARRGACTRSRSSTRATRQRWRTTAAACGRGEPAPGRYEDLLPADYRGGAERLRSLDAVRHRRLRPLPQLRPDLGADAGRRTRPPAAPTSAPTTAGWSAPDRRRRRAPLRGGPPRPRRPDLGGRAELPPAGADGVRLAMVAPAPVGGQAALATRCSTPSGPPAASTAIAPVFHVAGLREPPPPGLARRRPRARRPALDSVFLWVAPAVALANMILFGTLRAVPRAAHRRGRADGRLGARLPPQHRRRLRLLRGPPRRPRAPARASGPPSTSAARSGWPPSPTRPRPTWSRKVGRGPS